MADIRSVPDGDTAWGPEFREMALRINGLTSSGGLSSLNVKMFGVVGDAVTDDSTALKSAQAALTSGQTLYFPPNCRVRFAQQNPAGSAAIRIAGLSRVGVTMAPGAELIMDNLSSGAGTSHGIYVTGSADDVRLEGCRVRWATAPTSRSTGEAFRFLGYPSDSAPASGWTTTTGPVTNAQLINCTAINAPQCGALFMGCSDPRVVNFRAENTRADGLHFNACRRPITLGHVAKWDSAIGDDGFAVVTYQHDTTIWQGLNGPFNQATLGAWSNSNATASGVLIEGGTGNGCRISGSLGVTITGLKVKNKANSGLIIDSAIADGVSFNWSYHASRGVSVSNLNVEDTPIGYYMPAQNVDSSSNSAFWTFDVSIGRATIRGSTNYSVRIEGNGTATGVVAGLRMVDVNAIPATSSTGGKGGVSFSGLRSSRLDNIILDTPSGAQLAIFGQETALSGALSTLVRNNVSVGNVLCIGGKVLFQDLAGFDVQQARSRSSLTDGVQFVRTRDGDIGTVGVYLANRNNTGTVRGLHFQKALNLNVTRALVEHDSNNVTTWSSMEIGGGDATDVAANNLRVARFEYRNTLNQTTSNITVQGSTFAPINYFYSGAHYNGGEATPTWRAVTGGTLP